MARSENCWEGCLAFAVEGPPKLLETRVRLLHTYRDAPAHLQLPLHVTVKYLGVQPLSLHERLHDELRRIPATSMELETCGLSLTSGQSGCQSLQLCLKADAAVLQLQRSARQCMHRLGCRDDDQFFGENYRPHVTLIDGLPESVCCDTEALAAELAPLFIELRTLILLRKPAKQAVLPAIVSRWSATEALTPITPKGPDQ